jgi:diguanylate cyclase (GGDEF)-like protein/PAS domain S-box-containing protein
VPPDRNDSLTGHETGTGVLRLRAEQRLHDATPELPRPSLGVGNTERLVHELQVHQIELEMQNEELRNSRALLELALKRYTELYDFSPLAYFTLDRSGTILQTNLAGAKLLGLERARLTHKRLGSFIARHDLPSLNAFLGQVFDTHPASARELRLAGDREPPGFVSIEATLAQDGLTCNAVVTDITRLMAQQQQLERIAHYDLLTNLPNRVVLADRLQHAMTQCKRRGRSLAVAYLDLDGFKEVNDRHGHSVGDELLVTLAQRMKTALREGDTLARIGGDEFVAVLVDLEQLQDSTPMLVRLLQSASTPVSLDGVTLQVSASIGVTLYPKDASDADHLLRHADQAMYQAKQAGRNRYQMFDVHQNVEQRSLHENVARIRHALLQQEFVLYYQPKINMRSGAVIGVEALVRWQHPEHGLLLPAAFLPSIENHPVSVELGDWVLNTALTQMSTWHAAGEDVGISVNVGALQLQQGNFVVRLAAVLAAHPELKHRLLELEVLETSALENIAQVSEIMQACHALGVSFALDDFGTGYSSLTYLKHLPADLLKIDQSFVSGMLDDADDRAIVEAVIGLVRAFKRKVIAEGVETAAHGELLLALGCDLAQGFGIAHPMPAAEFLPWLERWRKSGSARQVSPQPSALT